MLIDRQRRRVVSNPDCYLAGDELPLTIGGSLNSPSVLPDFSAMLRAEAEEALQEEIEEEREELQERLQDRLRGLFDR